MDPSITTREPTRPEAALQTNAPGPVGRTLSRLVAKITETLLPPSAVSRIRTEREWKRWVESLTPELLDDLSNAPTEVKRQLFRAHVRLVEIETHARCNRVCSFCPNAILDRRRNKTLTDASLLDRVFEQLGSINYAGQIKVARYSEPLVNRQYLYERIASARVLVPRAQLAIVTNTDYLTPAVLVRLREAGLNVVYMSIYLKARERWTLSLAHAYSKQLAKKLGCRLATERETPVSLTCTYEFEGLQLSSACMNWNEHGTDRGGLVDPYVTQQRLSPCREPFETFVIDYNGSVMPCCNVRSDFAQHRNFIVGDLAEAGASIFDIYAGQLSAWRRSMVEFGAKGTPCTTCRHRDVPDGLVASIAARLDRRLHEITRSEHDKVAPAKKSQ